MGSTDSSSGPPRVIIHADVDAFYASIEQRDNPALRGLPIAVGGTPEGRGVVMTASYEARRFGVRSAMPSRTAIQLCPQLVLVPARFDAYHHASSVIMHIFQEFADAVEPLSMDEAFLDVSKRVAGFHQADTHARRLKSAVREATRLTVSLGVATTKLVAKIASDFQKPDGLTAVAPEQMRGFLAPLPVRRLWGVGPKTEAALVGAGFTRVGQLADAGDESILRRLGPWALRWHFLAQGRDDSVVGRRSEAKQMSREITFDRDTREVEKLRRTLKDMAIRLAGGIDHAGPPRTVHIKLRYADFRTITRQRHTGSVTLAADLTSHALELLESCWDGTPVRLIGLGLSNFVTRSPDQLSLFEE